MRRSVLVSFAIIAMLVTACGGSVAPTATARPPTATATALSTALPTVSTQLPLGSKQRPIHMALLAPSKNASGIALETLLTRRLGTTYAVDLLASNADVLHQLCSDKPTFALVDGPTLLAAQESGCGTVAMKTLKSDKSTGLKSDLIIHSGIKDAVTAIAGFRGKDFCRLNGSDVQGWVLPSIAMRAGGLNPSQDLKGIKEYEDNEALLQAVADGICVAAGIPSGTLNKYSPTVSSGQLSVLSTTPEMPYGGLVVSSIIPQAMVDAFLALVDKSPQELLKLAGIASLQDVKPDEYAALQKFVKSAGLSLASLGQ